MKFLLKAAAAAIALSFAASVYAADFSGLPVTKIILKDEHGNSWPRQEYLAPLLMIRPGDPFTSSAVRSGLEYLYLKGIFTDIVVEGFPEDGGVRLEYTLVPITFVRKVTIKGNHAVMTKAIEEILPGIEGRELREEKFPDIKANIISLYQAEGYYYVTVNFRQKQAEPHQVVLYVEIEESEPALIEEITFTGNAVFTQQDLLRTIRSKKGRPLKRDLLLDADREAVVQKYAKAGYPAAKPGPVSMSFRNRKAYVYIPVTEGPKVKAFFTGNREFSSKNLKQTLLIWSEHDVSNSIIEGSVEKIKNLYKEKGYADIKADVKRTESPGLLNLEFSVQEGPKTSVKKVIIQGNTFFTEKEIKRQMVTRESGWFTFMPYVEDALDKDADHILDLYVDSGFLSAVVKRSVILSSDRREAVVAIEINEGSQSRVRSISFEGNAVFNEKDLLEKVSLKTGAPFSQRLLDDDRYRILSAYSEKGYLYAKVEVEKKPVDGNEDVLYRITEDIPVSFGRIILRGNRDTRDDVILRELKVKSGEPYDYQAILKSQQRLYRLGYLGMARFEPTHPGEKEQEKDMLLTVEERPAGAVEVGAGYGDVDRLRGFVEVSHRNLWGSARSASLRFEQSDIAKRAIFNFREPWYLGYDLNSKFSLSWSDSKELNYDTREVYYQKRGTVVSYGVEKVYDTLKPSVTYQFENIENYNVNPNVELSPEDAGHVRLSSITPGLVLDLRDDPFNPQRGSLHGIAVKEAMKELGSEADFTKVTAQTSWFFPFDTWIIAALSARAGMAWPHGETKEIPINDRFKLGGSTTVRGYVHNSVGPTSGPEHTPIGGASMVVFNAELRTNPPRGFGLVIFTDAGNVWAAQEIKLHDLRASYGAGLRYNTPIGPLRVDYGQKIHRRPGESPGEIHFNIGHTF